MKAIYVINNYSILVCTSHKRNIYFNIIKSYNKLTFLIT